jgi:fructokinase
MLVYTANKDDVRLYMHDVYDSYPVPPITPISTIGAGDTFNAGLIYGLATRHIGRNELKHLNSEQRAAIFGDAIRLAGHVCMSYDNYISKEFADNINKNINHLNTIDYDEKQ